MPMGELLLTRFVETTALLQLFTPHLSTAYPPGKSWFEKESVPLVHLWSSYRNCHCATQAWERRKRCNDYTLETFHWNPVGNQSHPVKPSQQPEASLASGLRKDHDEA